MEQLEIYLGAQISEVEEENMSAEKYVGATVENVEQSLRRLASIKLGIFSRSGVDVYVPGSTPQGTPRTVNKFGYIKANS